MPTNPALLAIAHGDDSSMAVAWPIDCLHAHNGPLTAPSATSAFLVVLSISLGVIAPINTNRCAMSYTSGQNELTSIREEFDNSALIEASEADTRAKVITRILTRVLGWPEKSIKREAKSERGYADYILNCPNAILVVEAKRKGKHFLCPMEKQNRSYSINSIKSTSNYLKKAIGQARGYADDHGIEFACVTNGCQWLVYRAITTNTPWTKGAITIFRSFEDIDESFTEFWNLLSYEAVRDGALSRHFASASIKRPRFGKALDDRLYVDNPLQRNTLSPQLAPIIDRIFRDLTGHEQDEVLKRCYVTDRKVKGVATEVSDIFNDTLPEFARRAGFQDLVETENRSGALDTDFKNAVERGDFGTTILLLGGVGSGKTTFIHRFFRVTAKDFADKHCFWFYIPFTEAPVDSGELRNFLRKRILRDIKDRYSWIDIAGIEKLREIYQDELEEKKRGVWSLLSMGEQHKREAFLLEEKISNPAHCDAVLRWIRRRGAVVTIVLDNIDQRDPGDQLNVFMMAQELCKDLDAIVLVSLREESYFRASQSGAFNAYHNIRYHIASPDLRKLLKKRIEYLLSLSARGDDSLRVVLRSGARFDASQIANFMRIIYTGMLKRNPAIAQFIDAVSQGNMRRALDMFNQFLVSGATNVEKMLQIYAVQNSYNVAEHEVIKAVMLGDHQFYKGTRSPILNLFEISGSPLASNLTACRLLLYLERKASSAHSEGTGFVDICEVYETFANISGSDDDVRFHLTRLVKGQLIELDTAQVSTTSNATAARITKCGRYYFNILSGRFVYLDLVGLDTSVWNSDILGRIQAHATERDLHKRAYRTECFVQYLAFEEERSLKTAHKEIVDHAFGGHIIGRIQKNLRADLNRAFQKAGLPRESLENIQLEVAQLEPDFP